LLKEGFKHVVASMAVTSVAKVCVAAHELRALPYGCAAADVLQQQPVQLDMVLAW